MKLRSYVTLPLLTGGLLLGLSSCNDHQPSLPPAGALQPIGDALVGTWILSKSSGQTEHLSFSEMNPDASGLLIEERLVDGEIVSHEMASYRIRHNPLLNRGERISLEVNFLHSPANQHRKLTLLFLDEEKLVFRGFYSPATFTYYKR